MNKAYAGMLVVACASAATVGSVASPQRAAQVQLSDQERGLSPSRATSSVPAVENPHWLRSGCRVCHGDTRNFQPIPLERTDAICLTCHNGQRAPAELHPIGRTFTGPQIRRPIDWPTPGGKLACVTCHDVLQGCTHVEGQSVKNSRFLRDPSLVGTMAYCGRCHVESAHEKWNPHRMTDGGAVRNDACLSCHAAHRAAVDSAFLDLRSV